MTHTSESTIAEVADSFDYVRVREWMLASPRKSANQSFTSGPERKAAYLIEDYDFTYQQREKDVAALVEAASTVWERWTTTDWKAAPTAEYMHRLRDAVAPFQPTAADNDAWPRGTHNG